MPYLNEHSARISDPNKYKKTRRENDKFGTGIDVIWGIKDDGKTEIQAIRFDKTKFSVAEAKKWLKDHDYKPIEFEPAAEKAIINEAMQYKTLPFQIIDVFETKNSFDRKGNYGVIKGYLSTYGNVDKCKDIVLMGAFDDCIQDYVNKSRQLKVYHQHDTSKIAIGGVRPDNLQSDKTGLLITAEINLDVQLGREVYSLAKQGVYSDWSMGYVPSDQDYDKEGNRLLKKVYVYDASVVNEPANDLAKFQEVKNKETHKFFTITDIKNISSKKDFESALRESGAFSKEAATFLAAKFIDKIQGEPENITDSKTFGSLLIELKTLINQI